MLSYFEKNKIRDLAVRYDSDRFYDNAPKLSHDWLYYETDEIKWFHIIMPLLFFYAITTISVLLYIIFTLWLKRITIYYIDNRVKYQDDYTQIKESDYLKYIIKRHIKTDDKEIINRLYTDVINVAIPTLIVTVMYVALALFSSTFDIRWLIAPFAIFI